METLKTIWKFLKNFRYLKGMMQKTVTSVVSIENPHGDYYVIKLKPAEGLFWNSGEHVMLKLPDHETVRKEYRILSIASIRQEGVLLFGTRTGKETSAFKKVLLSLKPGDPVSVQGPFGWFRIRDEHSPIVLFAGGVGITPVRALVKELAHSQARPVHIVYSSSDFYLFGDEIEDIVDNNPSMTLYSAADREETQVQLAKLTDKYGNQAYYYMSSSPGVLDSVAKLLKSKGISGKRLIDDTMKGY
jgi:ferredoxin-NADP reductase